MEMEYFLWYNLTFERKCLSRTYCEVLDGPEIKAENSFLNYYEVSAEVHYSSDEGFKELKFVKKERH